MVRSKLWCLITRKGRNSLVIQWLRLHAVTAEGRVQFLVGIKIPQTTWCGFKIKGQGREALYV